ncbi:MAG: hypothetical protein IJL37_00285 [Bacteroidaceae bacterium]|nr:hypothetical protein [Bacteroidaceae bacterium]
MLVFISSLKQQVKVGEGKVKVKPFIFTYLVCLLSVTYTMEVKGEGKSMNPSSAFSL